MRLQTLVVKAVIGSTLPFVIFENTTLAAEFDNQPGLAIINAHKALERGITGAGVGIAVVDEGIQPDHPELINRLHPFQFRTANVSGDHGTHVAGTIAAERDGIGMHGVAPGALISSIEIFTPGFVGFNTVATGYNAALDNNLRIFNNSWSTRIPITYFTSASDLVTQMDSANSGTFSSFVAAMQRSASLDAVNVWATGNRAWADPSLQAGLPHYFPTLQSNWLAVTAVDANLNRASFANACGVAAQWCIAAPGVNIPAPVPTNQYDYMSGTSMATPHVTGSVAIARELFPNATGAQLASLVLQTATDIGAPGVDNVFGWGLLNVGNIVSAKDAQTGALFSNAAAARFATVDTVMSTLVNQTSLAGSAPTAAATAHSNNGDEGSTQAEDGKRTIWLQALGTHVNLDSGAQSPGATSHIGGLMGGVDLYDTGDTRAGVAMAYSYTHVDGKNSSDEATSHGFHGFGYVNHLYEDWFIDGIFGAGLFQNNYKRTSISGTVGTSKTVQGTSDTTSFHVSSRVAVGHQISFKDNLLKPYLYGAWNLQHSDGAKEKGAGIFSLALESHTLNQFEYGAGLQAQFNPYDQDKVSITPIIDLSYGRLEGDVTSATPVGLLGSTITSKSANVGQNIFRVGAQLNIDGHDGDLSGYVRYDGKFQANATSHGLKAGIRFHF